MTYSLLAHLYTHIKGSQEDIATYSLQYIVSQSKYLNQSFTKLICSYLCININSDLYYSCQVQGKNKERPDISCKDNKGKEIILCEAKFYAALTSNQPLAYIDRLLENKGKGLIFISPTARMPILWCQIKELCSEYGYEKINDNCINVKGIHLTLISWDTIIETLFQTASAIDIDFIADIKQLKGYCEKIEDSTFLPFNNVDLGGDVARNLDRYYEVVDATIDQLRADKNLLTSIKGLKATAYRKGYTRSILIDKFTITLNYDRDLWKNTTSETTPFWVAIRNNEWQQDEEILSKFENVPDRKKEYLWNLEFLSLDVKTHVTLEEISIDIKNQIINYIALI